MLNGGYVILQISFATSAVLKIGEYSRIFPSDVFRPIAHERKCLIDYNDVYDTSY